MIRRIFAALLALAIILPGPVEGARFVKGRSAGGGGGAEPYTWYTALDKATIPSHAGSGAWGSQRSIAEAAAPVPLTSVSVTTCSGFKTEMTTGARTITINADIDCSGSPVVSGNVTDVDVVIPPGRVLRSFYVGQFGSGHTATRLRFRGNTVGSHSGGQLHNIVFYATATDLIFDGIDITGPGVVANGSPPPNWIQQSALYLERPSGNARVAITNVRAMVGNYFFLGAVSDLIVTGSSFYSGAEPRQDSGVEGWVFRVLGPASGGTHVFYGNDLRGTRFHKIRFHPDGSTTYAWVSGNYFVDMNEARLLTANSSMVSSPKGYFAAFWVTNNESWTDINDPPNAGPDFASGSAAYVRFSSNVFHSDELTSDASLTVNDIEGLIPDGVEDWVKSGNTYGAMAAAPSWKSGTPGDPTGLSWNIGP